MHLPTPLVPPLDDNPRLVDLIVHATRQPAEQVRRRLYQEELSLGHNVAEEIQRRGIARNRWTDELIRFYQETDSFLYESVTWNRNPKKLAIRAWIGAYLAGVAASKKVLVYGDGPGFDSVYLAQAGQIGRAHV